MSDTTNNASIAKGYNTDFWDERYGKDEFAYGETPNNFLAENYQYFPEGGKILCLAEGEGRNAVFLAKQGFRVTAVDQSAAGQKKALQLAEKNQVNIDYELGDLNDYDLGEEKWDAIVSISAHTPPATRERLHKAIIKGLKPGGIFLLEGYNKQQLNYNSGGPKNEDMLFSLEELQNDFAEFTLLHAQNRLREVNEGVYHNGIASVTQIIAKK